MVSVCLELFDIITKVRKIAVLEFITLDGVIQAPGGRKEDTSGNFKYGGWLGPFFNNKVEGSEMGKQMKKTDALLLGRKTYDIWVGYWPTHKDAWPQVNRITKYVVSTTLKKPTWENTEVIKDVKGLKKLKKSKGPDIQVYGSSKLAQTLFKYDMVDELWLKIFPITLGTGKKLFNEGTMPASFKLTYSKVSPNGVIFANFKRAGKIKTKSVES